MRITRTAMLWTVLACAWSALALAQNTGDGPDRRLRIETAAFADGEVIPDRYTLASEAPISPPLSWKNAPAETASFALIMHDPDAVARGDSADIVHWIVFNIPGTVNSLAEDLPHEASLPDGTIQAISRRGYPGYTGPGARFVYHHYTFELFALDAMLELDEDTSREELMTAMAGHVIAKAAYVGLFHR